MPQRDAPAPVPAYLSSEVEEEGDAADHLPQPQEDEGCEEGAGGGRRVRVRGRRGRRRRRGALVGGAAAQLLGAAQVLGVVSAGATHRSSAPLRRLHTRLRHAPQRRQTTSPLRPGTSYKRGGQSAPGGAPLLPSSSSSCLPPAAATRITAAPSPPRLREHRPGPPLPPVPRPPPPGRSPGDGRRRCSSPRSGALRLRGEHRGQPCPRRLLPPPHPCPTQVCAVPRRPHQPRLP